MVPIAPTHRAFVRKTVGIILGLLFLVAANLIGDSFNKPTMWVSRQQTATNFQAEAVKAFSLGNWRTLSSLLWVKTLLDGDLEHYKKRDLNSWMFLRFKAITDLDPKFYLAYVYGGQYLSVIKDDKEGASYIFDKGSVQFPNDLWINFFGGNHFYLEMNDPEKAIELYEKAIRNNKWKQKFPYIPSLIARLKAKSGGMKEAFQVLWGAYQSTPKDSPLKEKYHRSLYAIKAEIDLSCLEKDPSLGCSKVDFDGMPYRRYPEGWRAQKEWQPFRPYK